VSFSHFPNEPFNLERTRQHTCFHLLWRISRYSILDFLHAVHAAIKVKRDNSVHETGNLQQGEKEKGQAGARNTMRSW